MNLGVAPPLLLGIPLMSLWIILLTILPSLFSAVKEGKKTVEEVLDDPNMAEHTKHINDQLIAETMQGDKFTKRSRPTLIYISVLDLFKDLIIFPYVKVFGENNAVEILTGDKFSQLMTLLIALGVARSVMDKQGNWVSKIVDRFKS